MAWSRVVDAPKLFSRDTRRQAGTYIAIGTAENQILEVDLKTEDVTLHMEARAAASRSVPSPACGLRSCP